MKTISTLANLALTLAFSPVYIWARCTGRKEMQESYEAELIALGVADWLDRNIPIGKCSNDE